MLILCITFPCRYYFSHKYFILSHVKFRIPILSVLTSHWIKFTIQKHKNAMLYPHKGIKIYICELTDT